jgi:membrane protease YdiL (CAAX protease family)
MSAILATMGAATIVTRLLAPPAPSRWHDIVLLKDLLVPIALFAVYARLVRIMEHRPAIEISPRNGLSAFPVGALLGALLMAAFFLTLWALGRAHFSRGTGLDGLASEILVPLFTATCEELLFRVVLFRILQEMWGSSAAIFVSALVFGLSHAVNPGATPLALAALSVETGVLLALAYMLTGSIWLAAGIHMGWNFTEGFVFGAYDSGFRDPHTLFRTTLAGADWLTGGRFGPEGSIVTLGYGLCACGVLCALVWREGVWEPPHFRMRPPPVGSPLS